MSVSVIQNNFIGGEVSPSLFGRLDDQLVGAGAATLKNFLVQPSGSLKKRSGFKFMRDLGTGRFRLIPFRFASDQTLVLVFGNNVMYVATQGQFVMNGGSPLRVSTPYSESEVWELEYSQNADVVTLTSPNVAPYELRRLGATNWEFKKISTVPTIQPPATVTATPTYPAATEDSATDDMAMSSEQRDIITAQYVVTAVDSDGVESEASGVAITKCNYYITGSTVEVSWSSVAGAVTYRVYRYVSGVYGFLAQTSQCSISDTGTTPDTSMTPPTHHEAFIGQASKGEIINISVIDGGKGYSNNKNNNNENTVYISFLPVYYVTARDLHAGEYETAQKTFKWTVTFISPEGQQYSGSVGEPAISGGGDGSTEKADVACSRYNKSTGFPISFTGAAPQPTPEWRVKSGYTHEGQAKLVRPTQSGEDFKQAGANAHRDISNWNNISKFSAMWESSNGISASQVLASMAANSETVELSISGGSGAKAHATVINGVIKSVTVLNGGSGYSTSSQVTVKSAQGSGARFRVEVSSDTPSEFPRASGQFDQRRVFAGSNQNPLKVWMTSAGKQSLMMTHIPIQDDDRIEVVAVASDADMVRHIVGMESLLLFTGSSELRVFSMNSDRLTPSTVGVRAQAYVGSNSVKPVVVGSNVIYIASRGGRPRQVTFSNSAQSYTSIDLGIRCPHLFDNYDIIDLSQSKAPVSSLWAVSTSGMLYGATFIPDQNINAWTRVDVGDKVESVCAIAEGTEDHVYIIVRRNGHAYLERMDPLTDTSTANYVDSYLAASFGSAQTTVSGLSHLNGRTVAIHGDGQYLGTAVVQGGAITLPKPASNVAVGLPLEAQLITLPFEYTTAQNSVFRERNPTRMYLRVSGKGNLETGIYPRAGNEHLYPIFRNETEYAFQNQESQVLSVNVAGNWDKQSQLEVVNHDTLPIEILSMLGEVQVSPVSTAKQLAGG